MLQQKQSVSLPSMCLSFDGSLLEMNHLHIFPSLCFQAILAVVQAAASLARPQAWASSVRKNTDWVPFVGCSGASNPSKRRVLAVLFCTVFKRMILLS